MTYHQLTVDYGPATLPFFFSCMNTPTPPLLRLSTRHSFRLYPSLFRTVSCYSDTTKLSPSSQPRILSKYPVPSIVTLWHITLLHFLHGIPLFFNLIIVFFTPIPSEQGHFSPTTEFSRIQWSYIRLPGT